MDLKPTLGPDCDFESFLSHTVPPNEEVDSLAVSEWLDSFLGVDPVLHDRMISEAQEPMMKLSGQQSDHSYSLTNSESSPDSPLDMKMESLDDELGAVLAPARPQVTATDLSVKQVSPVVSSYVKQENLIPNAAAPYQTSELVVSRVSIKIEPQSPDDDTAYDASSPPTPPSSSESDDYQYASAYQTAKAAAACRAAAVGGSQHRVMRSYSPEHYSPYGQHLFLNPIPTSGHLILSEEEKRTLVSEGYSIPTKLPLTKQEEKNLKKVRRKIKNKISAQESRRKKKEYVETLERRVEAYSAENCDLKRKVEHLESNNQTLSVQLQKLQGVVSRITKAAPGTQTGSCLMVLVLCFAVFLGGWSPLTSMSTIGFAKMSSTQRTSALAVTPSGGGIGPEPNDALVDGYHKSDMRSRVLLSPGDEYEDLEPFFGPQVPFLTYRDLFMQIFGTCAPKPSHVEPPKVESAAAEVNEIEDEIVTDDQPIETASENQNLMHNETVASQELVADISISVVALSNTTSSA